MAGFNEELIKQWIAYQHLIGSLRNKDQRRFFFWIEHYKGTLDFQLNTVLEAFLKLEKYIGNSFRTSLTNGFVEE